MEVSELALRPPYSPQQPLTCDALYSDGTTSPVKLVGGISNGVGPFCLVEFQSAKELPIAHNGNPLTGYRVQDRANTKTVYSTACSALGYISTRFDSPVHGFGKLYVGHVLSGWICIEAPPTPDDCVVTFSGRQSITIQGSALKVEPACGYAMVEFAIPWNGQDIDQSVIEMKFGKKTDWIGSCRCIASGNKAVAVSEPPSVCEATK